MCTTFATHATLTISTAGLHRLRSWMSMFALMPRGAKRASSTSRMQVSCRCFDRRLAWSERYLLAFQRQHRRPCPQRLPPWHLRLCLLPCQRSHRRRIHATMARTDAKMSPLEAFATRRPVSKQLISDQTPSSSNGIRGYRGKLGCAAATEVTIVPMVVLPRITNTSAPKRQLGPLVRPRCHPPEHLPLSQLLRPPLRPPLRP